MSYICIETNQNKDYEKDDYRFGNAYYACLLWWRW